MGRGAESKIIAIKCMYVTEDGRDWHVMDRLCSIQWSRLAVMRLACGFTANNVCTCAFLAPFWAIVAMDVYRMPRYVHFVQVWVVVEATGMYRDVV